MARATIAYNGWSGLIRDIRGNEFYRQLGKGGIEKPSVCHVCEAEHGPDCSNTYHAEEYGSTWQEYRDACRPVCPMCHGMIHVRFKIPNRFRMHKDRVGSGYYKNRPPAFKNLFSFFGKIRGTKDIPLYPDVDSGVEWLDRMPMHSYKGEGKVASVISQKWGEIPDPLVYGLHWKKVHGVLVRTDGSLFMGDWEQIDNGE